MRIDIDCTEGLENAITSYLHCSKCIDEKIAAKVAVGLTVSNGIQVWCENHDINMALFMPQEDGNEQQ